MKLLKGVVLTGLATALLAGAAWAGNMEARFGNTVVAKLSNGDVSKLYYNADNTFTADATQGGAETKTKGTWRQDGDNLCITSEAAFGAFEAGKERCVPLQGDKVGDSWQSKFPGPDGAEMTLDVSIVAGR